MPQFGKFKASVVLDGETLPKYSATSDETTKTIACWIPSQEGKAFSVDFESDPYPTSLKISVTTDGELIDAQILRHQATLRTRHFAEIPTSATSNRELLFSHIELTDDDAFLSANVKGLGEISVSVWEGIAGEAGSHKFIYGNVPEKKVHERSKKAMGHQVKFGQEKVIKPLNYVSFVGGPRVATFIFKYRSIDGIAPPEPAANKRKANEDLESDEDEGEEEEEDHADETDAEKDEQELKT